MVDSFFKIVETRIPENPFSGERLKGKLRNIWTFLGLIFVFGLISLLVRDQRSTEKML